MSVKITSPLFSDTASGSVKGFGTFRTRNGVTILTNSVFGVVGHPHNKPVLKQCFIDAKAAHTAIVPVYGFYQGPNGGWYGYRRSPTWPDFWAQWLIDNPSCLL